MPPTLLFDGVCNLCNAAVNFVLDHENSSAQWSERIHFASLDSPAARRMLSRCNGNIAKVFQKRTTLIFLDRDRCYTCSTGALHVARYLRFPWNGLALLVVIPPPLRDAVYDWVATNRYRCFGKSDHCRLPSAKTASRFFV